MVEIESLGHFLQNKEFLLDKVFTACNVYNCSLSKLNSLKHMCKSDRIKGINFCIVGTTFRKEFTSIGRLFFLSVFFFHCFFYFVVYILFCPLHFLCKNGIDPALTLVMSLLMVALKTRITCCY